jgi:heme/copper-type cytochrome/quinol oxidase subunit 3
MTAVDAVRGAPEALERPGALATEAPRGRPTGEWGMFLFVTTEATLFACLLASYFYVRFVHGGPWPPDGIEQPKLLKPLVMTALLLASSVTMVVADHAIRHDRPRRTQLAIPVTMLLGLAFLTLQGMEYSEKLTTFTWTTNAYGSLFYTITGFHGTHVVVGLLMLGHTEVAALRGKFTGGRHERVRMVSVYWHFVDVVWVAVLCSLYLSAHLGG